MMTRSEKTIHISFLVIICIVVLLPSINDRISIIPAAKINENRGLASKPDTSIHNPTSWVRAYDAYYADNFGLRSNLIKLYNKFEFYVLGVSPMPEKVILGKNGHFFNADNLEGYKGINRFSATELKDLKLDLAGRTSWCEAQGIKYYVAICPSKMSIYPEFLPDGIQRVSDKTCYDQVLSIADGKTVKVIDMRAELLKHKNEGEGLFQYRDDHWNQLGAYYGYKAIFDYVSRDFPELKAKPRSNFEISHESRGGNMTDMISLREELPENFLLLNSKTGYEARDGERRNYEVPNGLTPDDHEIVKINDHGKTLKCLVIRDSYTLLMMHLLPEHFRETVLMHDFWMARVREDLILREQPDIVLNILVETGIRKLLEHKSTLDPKLKLDGSFGIQAANGKFLCADEDMLIRASRDGVGNWETFKKVNVDANHICFVTHQHRFTAVDYGNGGKFSSNREKIGSWEKMEIINHGDGTVSFKGDDGKYLSLNEADQTISASAAQIGRLEKFKLVPKI